MTNPKALVLEGDGINCEIETQYALNLAGFDASLIHVTDLLNAPENLRKCKLLVIPGGFAFGDEIASGKVLALKLMAKLSDILAEFIDTNSLLMGTCNGFQVLVQMGLLPMPDKNGKRMASLIHNLPHQFINRWVSMQVNSKVECAFLNGLTQIELPIRHGEGRLHVDQGKEDLVKSFACLNYEEDVNGSFDRIAGLTNKKGNVFGLMPHPEAYVRWSQHPNWTSRAAALKPKILVTAVNMVSKASANSSTFERTSSVKDNGALQKEQAMPDGLAILKSARSSLS